MTRKGWLRLGTIPPTELVSARLELHWAAQLPAAAGIARATPTPDYAQHALVWDAPRGALASALVPGPRPYRVGLRLADETLLLLGDKGTAIESLPLAGRTLREGLEWCTQASQRYTGASAAPLALPGHELPDHPVAGGARFGTLDLAHAAEISRWFANLAAVLPELARGRKASPTRVWSHHFDLDTVLDRGGERTLGFGFSPGDDSFAEPYLYVLPNPEPEASALRTLPAPMEWVTDGWVGAVLRGSGVAALASDAQAELVERFYRFSEESLASSPE